MKSFSPIIRIIRESVLTVPYINIGGQWDSSHHKLSRLNGTIKGQLGQFKNLPHKNLSSLKGQKSKKGHFLTAHKLCKKKQLSPLNGTVQENEEMLVFRQSGQKDEYLRKNIPLWVEIMSYNFKLCQLFKNVKC